MAEAERLNPELAPALTREDEADLELEITLLLEAIYVKFRYDFRRYSRASLRRRVLAILSDLRVRSVSALQERIIHEPSLFSRVLPQLTVPTTEMFRDPGYFLLLRRQVAPILRTYPSLKIWIAGCSTGEEVYSFAILLHEEGLLERTLIYATDINPLSLKRAQEGIYPCEELRKHTTRYIQSGGKAAFGDYYSASYGSALMASWLRRGVVFSDHSLATDQVFSETHLVSCRNVLIYFEPELQSRAIGLFHDSLIYGGFLGLGSKETLQFTRHAASFDVLSREEKIYQKRA